MQLLTVSLGLININVPVEGFKGLKPLKPFAYPYPYLSRTVTLEPQRHVTVGRSHDQTGSDPSRDQAPKPASNQSCDKEQEHDLMHAYFCRRNLCYVHDRY